MEDGACDERAAKFKPQSGFCTESQVALDIGLGHSRLFNVSADELLFVGCWDSVCCRARM